MTDLAQMVADGGYPASWDEFIGQELAKRQLMIAAKSAKMRKQRMAHTLLSAGTPGIGKTSLAFLIASELGGEVKIVSGQMKVAQARILINGMADGDILFWDEIHMAVQGGKANAEWLLNFLQDGVIMGPMGAELMPKITLIGATTDAGKLPETILQRFSITNLQDYEEDEAAAIAFQLALKVFGDLDVPFPSMENFEAIAKAAIRQPRMMRNLLIDVRDIALAEECANYDRETQSYDITEALSFRGLDPDGLDAVCRAYLVALMGDFAGGAGEKALADRLQQPGGVALQERVLMKKGLIAKTKAGRVLTSAGMKRAHAINAASAAAA